MAQGPTKKSTAARAATKKTRHTVLGLKKGKRTIAPRRATLVKQQQAKKKLAAVLTAGTERQMAEKAGHLELLKQQHKKRVSSAPATKTKEGGKM